MPLVNNTASLPPPTSGADAYNSDIRPALGGTYYDSTFDTTVKRLSDDGIAPQDDMYAHCWANADGTLYFRNSNDGAGFLHIHRTSDGQQVLNVTDGDANNFDLIWHPTDPDKFIYRSGNSLIEWSVSGNNQTWTHNFGHALESLGGSINWIDRTGRYYVVAYNDGAGLNGYVYDRTDNALFTGSEISGSFGAGYLGISPDGKYVIYTDSNDFYSHALNLSAKTVGAAVMFMRSTAAPSDHAAYLSASDGVNYGVTKFDAFDSTHMWKFDISVDRSGMTNPQIEASSTAIMTTQGAQELEIHMAHGPNGRGQDWVFIGHEDSADGFNDAPSPWRRYKQELTAVNLVTGDIRRICHHRSRNVATYYYQPRPSCAWDGSLLIWTSNFNDSAPAGYNDLYGVENPLGGGFQSSWARAANPQGALL